MRPWKAGNLFASRYLEGWKGSQNGNYCSAQLPAKHQPQRSRRLAKSIHLLKSGLKRCSGTFTLGILPVPLSRRGQWPCASSGLASTSRIFRSLTLTLLSSLSMACTSRGIPVGTVLEQAFLGREAEAQRRALVYLSSQKQYAFCQSRPLRPIGWLTGAGQACAASAASTMHDLAQHSPQERPKAALCVPCSGRGQECSYAYHCQWHVIGPRRERTHGHAFRPRPRQCCSGQS